MRLPNLNGVRAFECAARHLNFRLAAVELNLTQGAVAQQVRKLEASLGQKLFVRKARGLELTDKGAAYFSEIHAGLSRIAQATARLAPATRTAVLSVPPSFAAKWLMPRLADFEARFPDIDLQIIASEQLADFTHDGVDLAVRLASPPFAKGLTARLLSPLNRVAVASTGYAADNPAVEAIPDFRAHRLLEDGHRPWRRLFADLGIELPARVRSFNQTALAIEAALSGRGVAIAPSLLVDAEVAAGDLQVLWRDAAKADIGYYVVSPATEQPRASPVSVVRDWLCIEAGASVPS